MADSSLENPSSAASKEVVAADMDQSRMDSSSQDMAFADVVVFLALASCLVEAETGTRRHSLELADRCVQH